MMVSRSVLRYIRISPRKFRQIIPLVKGKGADEALFILMAVKKGASKYAIELINSAIANARRKNAHIDTGLLIISNLIANDGPQLKRFRAASMGRASMIRKRTCHITLELDYAGRPEDTKEAKAKAPQARGKEAPGAGQEAHGASAERPKKAIQKGPRHQKDAGKKEKG